MNILIKKLTKADWKTYKELRLQMLSEEPQAYSQTVEELVNRTDAEWKEKTASDTMAILTIRADNKLAGMNGLFYETPKVVTIWGMFIRREFRRMGLGRKLMGAMEKEIKKDTTVKTIQVSVTPSQVPAWKLYKKLGFREVGRSEKKKTTGELYEEISMEKSTLLS